MAISSSSVLKANNPPLQWKQRFVRASSPPFSYPTLRINVCFAKPATEKLCCSHQVSANSSSSPRRLVFEDGNNVVVVPCIKKQSSGSPSRWSVIGTTNEESSWKKIVGTTIHEESLKDTSRHQAMAAMTVLGSLLIFMGYGHLPALAASGGVAGRSKFPSLRSPSSSRFFDSEGDRHDDYDRDHCPSATEDQARNDASETTCDCKSPASIRTSWTYVNPGRRYMACIVFPWKGACSFFEWLHPPVCRRPRHLDHELLWRFAEVDFAIPLAVIVRLLWFPCATLILVGDMVDNWDVERKGERYARIAKCNGEG